MNRTRSLAFIVALVILSLSLTGCGLVTASVRMLSEATPTRIPRPQALPLATRTPRVQAQPQTQSGQPAPTELAKPTPGAIPGQGQGEAQPGQSQQSITVPAVADADSQVFTAVYKKVSPSVVRIDNLTSVSDSA